MCHFFLIGINIIELLLSKAEQAVFFFLLIEDPKNAFIRWISVSSTLTIIPTVLGIYPVESEYPGMCHMLLSRGYTVFLASHPMVPCCRKKTYPMAASKSLMLREIPFHVTITALLTDCFRGLCIRFIQDCKYLIQMYACTSRAYRKRARRVTLAKTLNAYIHLLIKALDIL